MSPRRLTDHDTDAARRRGPEAQMPPVTVAGRARFGRDAPPAPTARVARRASRCRRAAFPTAISVAVLTTVMLASAGVADARRCRFAGTTTVVQTTGARIFTQAASSGSTRYYGCLKRRNRRVLMSEDPGEADFSYGFGVPRLRGRYAAFAETFINSAGEGGTSVHVFNLRRRQETVADSSVPSGDTSDATEWSVSDLVLTRGGFVAWISKNQYAVSPAVLAHDSAGLRQLDSGNIDAESLELSGSTATWMKDGTAQTATLS